MYITVLVVDNQKLYAFNNTYLHTLLKEYQNNELDLLEELKKHLNNVNIKFEEGDWQSFPKNYNKNL